MNKEIWRDIQGYEEYYQVSNIGRVRSLDRLVVNTTKSKRLRKGRVLIPQIKDNGYMVANLSKNNRCKTCYIHRLVAKSFIPNPHRYNTVNHIDETRDNNNAMNLEWCTHGYNLTYNNAMQRMVKSRNKSKCRSSEKAISQYSLDGSYIKSYPSVAKASIALKTSEENIRSALKGKSKTAEGYQWIYQNGKRFISPYRNNRLVSVIQYTMNGELIKRHNSIAEAGRSTNSNASKVHSCCKGERKSTNKFRWSYDPTNSNYISL